MGTTDRHAPPAEPLADGVRGDHHPGRTPRWNAWQVVVAVVIALLVGSLLNAQSLLATAQRQPFGWQRDVAMAVTEPLAAVSAALRLDRPRHAIDVALGRVDEPAPATPREQTPTADPAPTPDAPIVGRSASEVRDLLTGPADAGGDASEPQGPAAAERRTITPDEPLRMYVGGDSMVGQFGWVMEILADRSGLIEITEVQYEFGSGLSRPDFIDWPERLAGVSAIQAPDVMVLYFGGNDAQPLEIDGAVHEPEDEPWQVEYRARVADLMDQLVEAGHHVYWMGMPIPRSEVMVRRLSMLNEIYESEAAERAGVTFVPMWDLFAGPDGRYSEYLENEDGELLDMRLQDGIHLTTDGAFRAARPTLARIAEDYDFDLPDDL